MISRLRCIALLALALASCKPESPTPPQTSAAPKPEASALTIAAAADLKFALDQLIKDYRAAHPATTVNVTYGSSGNFFAQLQNKAPFDLFLSADVEYPRKLIALDLGLDKDAFLYAVGRIVIWTPKTSPIDVEKLGIKSLADPTVKKIAVANPQHAPYGKAAVAALKSLNVFAEAEPKLVYGENIAQTAQFIQTGSADIGIIALALALAPEMKAQGHYWEIPLDAYPTMEQGGMIMKWTKDADAARSFRDHLLSDKGRELLKRHGFSMSAK